MSLTLLFPRSPAIEAGLKHRIERVATDAEIEIAVANQDNPDYIDYLRTMQELIRVPGTKQWRENYLFGMDDQTIQVTANKWGSFYEPLIQFLREHGIEWEEC